MARAFTFYGIGGCVAFRSSFRSLGNNGVQDYARHTNGTLQQETGNHHTAFLVFNFLMMRK